jgi:phenylpyruvate tautomerase PptA (4-oxalocrotonate tautomerase family)
MPYISIKTDYLMENIEVSNINKNICETMNVPRSRIKVSWEIFHQGHFYSHPPEDEPVTEKRYHRPVVEITVSKRNPRSFVEELVAATIKEVCQVLGTKEDKILVLIHSLDEGDIFLNGTYV